MLFFFEIKIFKEKFKIKFVKVLISLMEEGYIDTLIAINKNLRDQLEITYKLLKLKIKTEPSEKINRLDILINELEILKTSLTFSLQKQAEIAR